MTMAVIALVVSVCALVFTLGSFWWLNVRTGRLRSWDPHSYAAYWSQPLLLLRLPLVIHNTGAAPIVVQDIQLSFPKEPTAVLPLPWRNSRTHLRPGSDDEQTLPAVFAVPGRTAQQMFVEFGAPFPGVRLEGRDYTVRVDVRLGHRKGWRTLLTFTLRAGGMIEPDRYLAYSNRPAEITAEMQAKANAALWRIIEQLQGPSSGSGAHD